MPETPSPGAAPDPTGRVRLRDSLVLRLFALVTVVAVVAVAVTAWLTVSTTAGGIRQEQGDVVAASASIEDSLTRYGATHADWTGVRPLVVRLSRLTGNRVTLTDGAGRVLADSATGVPQPQRRAPASTVIDALNTGPSAPAAQPAAGGDSFAGPPPDGTAVSDEAAGPFALSSADAQTSRRLADGVAECLEAQGVDTEVEELAGGRAAVLLESGDPLTTSDCDAKALETPYDSEVAPLDRVQTLLDRCLARRDGPEVTLRPDLGWDQQVPRTIVSDSLVVACLTSARRSVLRPYVAPATRLTVSSTRQEPTTFLDLSPGNRLRIGGVVLLVLVLSLGFAALAGRQLVRPLAALATAAGRVREGDLSARAEVRSRDEIGRVAAAFNTMAERRGEAEALRKAMVGDVAHELRNPISTMRGTLEAAQDGLVPVDAALVASLMEETLLLQHVVEDLRDLAAADAGDLRLAMAPVVVGDLLDHVATAHRAAAAARDVEVVVDVEPGLVVPGDELRLRQVVGNLVTNAVRHSEAGGRVELLARTASETASGADSGSTGSTVELVVADHGEGIAADDLPHVFERFWRADPSRTRSSGGSGLGLAIVRQLVESHGGTVDVESTLGEGSRFVVRLPAG